MVTEKQRGKIFSLAKEMGLTKEELHDIVRGVTGVEHISHLSAPAASDVICELLQRKHTSPPKMSTAPEMITDSQRGKIWRLIEELEKYDEKSDHSFDERIRRLTGIANKTFRRAPTERFYIRDLTKQEAKILIDTIKRYISQAKKKFENTVGDADGAEQKP